MAREWTVLHACSTVEEFKANYPTRDEFLSKTKTKTSSNGLICYFQCKTMLLTDAAESMHNALPAAWSHATRGMCYVHVYRNVENAAKKFVKAESKRMLFLKEFGDLSASWSQECSEDFKFVQKR